MTKKQIRAEAEVNCLIALCHILDDYKEFNNELEHLLLKVNCIDFTDKLDKIYNGKTIIGARNIKKFYKKYKEVIDTIYKYSNINKFISNNYELWGAFKENSDLDLLYTYITNHRENLDTILSLLEKIKDLGINYIKLEENQNFTKKEYKMYTNPRYNYEIYYLDNMEAIPNYVTNTVEYKTNGSNYEIIIASPLEGKITVNSLLFDKEKLPDEIDKTAAFETILKLKEKKLDGCAALKNSVDFSIAVDDLQLQFNTTEMILRKIENVNNKEQLYEALAVIKSYLEQIKMISSNYDDRTMQEYPCITRKKLRKEKSQYLDRRYISHLD